MAPLKKPFSLAAYAIESQIAEGDAEAAMHKLIAALRSDEDSKAIRYLAAAWIENIGLPLGSAKALRKGQKPLLQDFFPIAEMVTDLQDSGATYAHAVAQTAEHFDRSERHVQSCVAQWRAGMEIHREAQDPQDP